MPHTFSTFKLNVQLEKLPTWKVLAFGTFLLERALPNFIRFQAETSATGGSVLLGVLGKARNVLQTRDVGPFGEFTSEACNLIAPDTEDFCSLYTSAALDAAVIAGLVADYIGRTDCNLVVEAAVSMRDTLDLFLLNAGAVNSGEVDEEEQLRLHPLMQAELTFQSNDLKFLASISDDQSNGWQKLLLHSLDNKYGMFTLKFD